MIHRNKKIKFKGGKDATDMLVRKLVVNFLEKGKLTTTITKAKVLKTVLEKLVEKAKDRNEANKNYLLRYGIKNKLIELMFVSIGPALIKISGGYVKINHLGSRMSDGAEEAKVEWAYPIVIEKSEARNSKSETNPNNKNSN